MGTLCKAPSSYNFAQHSVTRTYMLGKNVKMGFSTITYPDLLFKYSVSVGF